METADETSALAAALGGDEEAFAALVRLHGSRVTAVCVAFLGNSPDADDAAQETFLKAWDKLSSYRKEAAFSTWLCAIARRHCLDILQKRTNSRTQSLDELVELKGDTFAAPQAQAGGLAHEDVAALLEALPPDYRLALSLRETQGLSYAEIAREMDCSVDSVKARLKRARRLLLERSRHFLEEPPSNKGRAATGAL
ncbi:MAG TPA: RNA polymerase sigma factor [Elusimicrobiales bacterium]|nr:RNA polymerase sigma factor [Elusimicrobiales bacterium]